MMAIIFLCLAWHYEEKDMILKIATELLRNTHTERNGTIYRNYMKDRESQSLYL